MCNTMRCQPLDRRQAISKRRTEVRAMLRTQQQMQTHVNTNKKLKQTKLNHLLYAF
jgi:hypothetical protein